MPAPLKPVPRRNQADFSDMEAIKKAQSRTDLRPWEQDFWLAMVGNCPKPAPARGEKLITPEQLWNLACLYFAGAKEDVMVKKDFIRSGESAGKIVEMTTERPFSWTSLEIFLAYKGVCYSLRAIRENQNGSYGDYQDVVNRIDQVIYQQKFDGAAIGGYNPQLIIRDLGLAEKVDASVKQEQPLFGDTPQAPTEE